MRLMLATLAMLVLMSLPALAGGGGGGDSCSGFAEGEEVALRDSCFEPVALLRGDAGAVTVRNQGGMPHTFTAVDGSFDSGVLKPGELVEVEVPAGLHRVYCTLHADPSGAGMSGVVVAGLQEHLALAAASTPAADGRVVPTAGLILGAVLVLLLVLAGISLRRRQPEAVAR